METVYRQYIDSVQTVHGLYVDNFLPETGNYLPYTKVGHPDIQPELPLFGSRALVWEAPERRQGKERMGGTHAHILMRSSPRVRRARGRVGPGFMLGQAERARGDAVGGDAGARPAIPKALKRSRANPNADRLRCILHTAVVCVLV